ncbi:OLC1v1026247C1 [Oldenlandia corymbosa var. corymbosa]|uniref:RING-type E3 ubiquitin transferase n=1 Tax=Oldenlandia corymbosa var. corymbosa TaxID=529605 RepID=A0AAV1C8Y6_OLDCO|nr:OLC1v1026247C1 [Oldenlandia corymbosa var. corymbosa]
MMSSGINLVMTVIGFAVSILFIVFVCTRLICARIQMSAARRSIRGATRSDLSVLERGLHGVEHVILSNFPTKKYSDGFFSSAETIQCTVCLADYNKEDTLRILPACGHFFHASCIDAWLYQHSTCPVCRISLREVTEKKRFMQPLFSSAIRGSAQSTNSNTYGFSSNGHRISFPTLDNHRTAPARGECFHSEGGRAGDGESRTICDDWDVTRKPENKQVETPSSA